MARSVREGFDVFLQRLIPTETQRLAKERHRSSVETCLNSRVTVKRYREIGSFTHGTGVRNHADADLLVSLGGTQPGSSDTALGWIKTALQAGFPYTSIYIRRPAVVIDFAGGEERWEITPGFLRSRNNGDPYVYNIPAADRGWMTSAPVEHISYVNSINNTIGIAGAAKKLARLAKAWKYYNSVPISSFYLEMRAAQHMKTQTGWSAVWDICLLLEKLEGHALADMNDPMGITSRFAPCSSAAKKTEALSKLHTGATRARKALDAYNGGTVDTAFYYLDLLFGGQFPSR